MTEDTYVRCGICTTYLVVCQNCKGSGCIQEQCKSTSSLSIRARVGPKQCSCVCPECCTFCGSGSESGYVCPKCCTDPQALRGAGWSSRTTMQAFKPYKEMIREALDEVIGKRSPADWAPVPTTDGKKVMREAWSEDGWHIGVEEAASQADESVVFRGMAENEGRGVRCRLPGAWVDRIRQVSCPEAPGRSE